MPTETVMDQLLRPELEARLIRRSVRIAVLEAELAEARAEVERLKVELALMDGVIHLECGPGHHYSTHKDHASLGCPECLTAEIERLRKELVDLREEFVRMEDAWREDLHSSDQRVHEARLELRSMKAAKS